MIQVKIHTTHIMAYVPEYKNSGMSGAELLAAESTVVQPGSCSDVAIGVSFAIPSGYEGQIRNVRSMLIRHATILGGLLTVNANDESSIVIPIMNHSNLPLEVNMGMVLGQIVFNKIEHAKFERRKV